MADARPHVRLGAADLEAILSEHIRSRISARDHLRLVGEPFGEVPLTLEVDYDRDRCGTLFALTGGHDEGSTRGDASHEAGVRDRGRCWIVARPGHDSARECAAVSAPHRGRELHRVA